MKKFKTVVENPQTEEDFDILIKQMFAEFGNVCFANYNNSIYMYKLLNRKAYKTLISNPNLTQIEKEDEVCKECILWPRDFNPDEYEAGLPTYLFEQIMTNSYLTGTEDMIALIEVSREETDFLESQMSCIISEAFPSYTIDEIEEWDMIKFCKIYTKAEWKLKNLRSFEFNTDMLDFLKDSVSHKYEEAEEEIQEEVINSKTNVRNDESSKVKVGNREMSQQEYKQYLDFQKQFPDIAWGADAMYTGFDTQTISTVPTPLRVK